MERVQSFVIRVSSFGFPAAGGRGIIRQSMTNPAPVLDVRDESRFLAGHAPGAASLPLEEIARRSHELPPKGSPLRVFDDDPARRRAAAETLRLRGYVVEEASLAAADLTETGPARVRLWQPSPLLVEALELIGAVGGGPRSVVAPHGPDATERVPPSSASAGRALDVACGSGREAVHLALAGWRVEAVDILPDALLRAQDLARRSGVAIATQAVDLRQPDALPKEAYDLVTVFRFLHRPALPVIGRSVKLDGILVYEAFNHRDTGGGEKPLKPARLLQDGELAEAFEDFEVLLSRDGVERGGRVFSQLVGRRR
jgi:SAM-dependent methyltransferase